MTAIYEHHAQLDSPETAPDASDCPLRVLVVDDHPAVRMGLRELFEDQPDFVVVAAVDSADAAMALAEREPIDVAVVDYQLGSRNGLWLSRKLKRLPQPPLLAGIPAAEISVMLSISSAGLESRLWTMLRKLEALPGESISVRRARPHNGRRRGSPI